MNIVGNTKDHRLIDLTRDYVSSRDVLAKEVMTRLTTERAKFALKVLSVDDPIKYLEAVVRNEIARNSKQNSEYELVAVNHHDMDNVEKTKGISFDPVK